MQNVIQHVPHIIQFGLRHENLELLLCRACLPLFDQESFRRQCFTNLIRQPFTSRYVDNCPHCHQYLLVGSFNYYHLNTRKSAVARKGIHGGTASECWRVRESLPRHPQRLRATSRRQNPWLPVRQRVPQSVQRADQMAWESHSPVAGPAPE